MYEDILGPKDEIKHRKFKLDSKEEVLGLKGKPIGEPGPPEDEEIPVNEIPDLWALDLDEDEDDEDEDDIGKKSPIICDCENKCPECDDHGC